MDKIKNFLKTNRLFWKYRHFVDSGVWHSYLLDSQNPRRKFYVDFIKQYNVTTVFEFGCASGPNLGMIRENYDTPIKFYGYDINKDAIKLANNQFGDANSVFKNKLSSSDIEKRLSIWAKDSFDLAICDRVLYLLSEREVTAHFSTFGKYFEYVIIDDFHNPVRIETNGAYHTKNYVGLLSACGFDLASEGASKHIKNDTFFRDNAKRLVFRKCRGPSGN